MIPNDHRSICQKILNTYNTGKTDILEEKNPPSEHSYEISCIVHYKYKIAMRYTFEFLVISFLKQVILNVQAPNEDINSIINSFSLHAQH